MPPRTFAVPVFRYDPVEADKAFAVHSTLKLAEAADPALAANEHWREQCDIALARFLAAYEAPA